jgi:hypothetical protein
MKDHEKYAEEVRELFKDDICECDCEDKEHQHDSLSGFCAIHAEKRKSKLAIIHIQGQIDEIKEGVRWIHGVSEYAEGRVVFLQKAIEHLKTKI